MAEKYNYECYQKNSLLEELLLLEKHLSGFKCEWCIFKHKTTVKALAKETIAMTNDNKEKVLFQQIIDSSLNDIHETHELRTKLMEITPKECGFKVISH